MPSAPRPAFAGAVPRSSPSRAREIGRRSVGLSCIVHPRGSPAPKWLLGCTDQVRPSAIRFIVLELGTHTASQIEH